MTSATAMARIVFAALVALLLTATMPSGAGAKEPVAVLQGLNKITARVSEIEARLDRIVVFGTLEVTIRACFKAPPEEPPESAAYLEIKDIRPGEEAELLFTGWMFASSPALSALEHPVYDIWVLDCRDGTPLLSEPGSESE